MKKIIKRPVFFYLMTMLFLFFHEVSFSQVKEFTGRTINQSYARGNLPNANHPGKYLKKYSIYSLDINEIALFTKSNSPKAQFILNLSADRFKVLILLC